MARDLLALQNGSDIRGVAICEKAEDEAKKLDGDAAERIAKAFLLFLSEKLAKKPSELYVAVGRDSRLTGEELAGRLARALSAHGCKVGDAGLASTPAMFMATKFESIDADGAIMITASHLPKNRNGFKFFTKDGGLEKADIRKILETASDDEKLAELVEGSKMQDKVQEINLMQTYSAFLRDKIKNGVCATDFEKPLAGLKIVIDAGNGAGGFYARDVLAPLGADVSDSLFLEPDGNFPNHIPNPEDEDAMKSISSQVSESGADLGIIFDTDVDRAGAVDESGKAISRNAMIALAAAILKDEGIARTTVVTDSVTSNELTDFIENVLKFKHHRFKRGYKNVINESIALNSRGEDSELAIETSGHGAFKENYFLDDGAYLATKIVIAAAKLKPLGKGINSLITGFKEPLESIEIRVNINCENFSELADRVIADMNFWLSQKSCMRRNQNGELELTDNDNGCLCKCGMSLVTPNFEGIRINFDTEKVKGWALLRKSLHESLMPINIEAQTEGGAAKIAKRLKEFLKNYKELDLSKL